MLKAKSVDPLDDLSKRTTNIKKNSHSLNTGPRNPAYTYYLLVRPELREWWHEFSTQWDPVQEGWRYRTARQFAKAKTGNRREQEWIEGMIGHIPLVFGTEGQRRGKVLYVKIPWLGDWEARRTPPEQPAHIRAFAKLVRERLVAWDAIRACAPLLIQELAIYDRLDEQIDEAFCAQAFVPSHRPTGSKNKTRFRTYVQMKQSVMEIKISLLNNWMLVNGIHPKEQ